MKSLHFIVFVFISCCSVLNIVQSDEVGARIYGGTEIRITDAPYQVSVRIKSEEAYSFGYGHICGGSVITKRAVLTAAHCIARDITEKPIQFRNAREYILVMGDTYLIRKTSDTLQYDVQQIIVHPNFNKPNALENDVAIMFIRGDIPTNRKNVQPIPLNRQVLSANTVCEVSGWGKINSAQIPNNLMQAVIPIVAQKVCERNYGRLPESMMCAGYMVTGGIDACQGDSGGPLTCNKVLAGIVSWGTGCAKPGFPGIYSNVSYFYGWIEQANSTFNYSNYSGGANLLKAFSSLILIMLSLIIANIKISL